MYSTIPGSEEWTGPAIDNGQNYVHGRWLRDVCTFDLPLSNIFLSHSQYLLPMPGGECPVRMCIAFARRFLLFSLPSLFPHLFPPPPSFSRTPSPLLHTGIILHPCETLRFDMTCRKIDKRSRGPCRHSDTSFSPSCPYISRPRNDNSQD